MTIELALLSGVTYRGREVVGARLQDLLALLAGELRTGCATATLIDALWPDARPEHPSKALQGLVFRARAQLGPDVIVSTPRGYRLALSEEQVDATALVGHAAAATRSLDPAAALAEAEAGLALCDPPSGDDGATGPLAELRLARAGTYRALVRARALALSGVGRHADALVPLTDAAGRDPRDEEVLAALLRSEAATRGVAAALARYDTYRRALRDELGTDPGPALREVHARLLRTERPPVRHGIPHDPNPLLGRERDVAAVTELLRTSRVASVVGLGGLGKTRLAYAVARAAPQRVVFVVPLAGITGDGEVVREVATVLGVGDAADVVTGIAGALGPGPALLVLDNCEHVVRGAADLARSLVAMTSDLRILTTSRTPLGISSESVYPLPELGVATSAQLFRQRALAVRPDADLPDDAVREVCRHLDGLPLAVELAAARVRALSVGEIARRLDGRFGLLRHGPRDAPERHRTLAAVIDWSWNLLEPSGRAAMGTLSVFPGGFTVEAAGTLLGVDDPLPVLEHLVDQSLLAVTDTATGVRFRMSETVREFGALRRDEDGRGEAVTERFLTWARDYGRDRHDVVFGPDVVDGVRRIRAEQDNLLLALRLGLDRGDGGTVAAVSAVLGGLWTVESNFARLITLGEECVRVLSHLRPAPDLVEATRTATVLAALIPMLLSGTAPLRALVSLRRLPPATPQTLIGAADTVLRSADPTALADRPEPLLAAVANGVVSYAAEARGDGDGAVAAAERMLAALRGTGNRWVHAVTLSRLGETLLAAGRYGEASRHLIAVLPTLEDVGARPTAARVRWAVAFAALRAGDLATAERVADEGGDDPGGVQMFDLAVRAEIHLGRGETDAGLRLWREAHERLRSSDDGYVPGVEAWMVEVQAGAVIAHALAGRLDLVPDLVDGLPRGLADGATGVGAGPKPGLPTAGALLLALALVDLTAGSERAARAAVPLVALAERCGVTRGFQSPDVVARARVLAEDADRPAYADAVAAYARLDQQALPDAVAEALASRAVTGPASGRTPIAPTGSPGR